MREHAIDWEVIHQRLAVSAAAIAGETARTPEEVRRILESRACAAAQPPVSRDDAERIDVLAFKLAGETWGVETCHVREVCEIKDLTPLPCTPPFVAGVMNLHAQILAILDLRMLFDLPAKGITELNRVIVLRDGGNELGLLADSIDGFRSVIVSDIQPGLPTLAGVRERFLRGVTGEMLAVLDGGCLLSDAGLKVDERPLEQPIEISSARPEAEGAGGQ